MHQPLLKIGVLGASRIVGKALCNVAPGLIDVSSIAARELSRAQAFAQMHGIQKAYGSYQELISDPELDAVYVALPCSEHMPWTMAALRAGKHVLCEKPFALDLKEANAAVVLGAEVGKILMEAHHWRYHPLVQQVELALQGIGEVRSIEAQFNGALNNPGDIRTNPQLGPGVLMDFGCYLIQWIVWAAEASGVRTTPTVRSAKMIVEPEVSGVDMVAQAELVWGNLNARLACDMRDGTSFRSYVRIEGTQKSVHFENPLFTDGSSLTVTAHEGAPDAMVVQCPPGTTTYRQQLQAFCESVRTGQAPLTSGDNILQTQRLLDAIYHSAGVISRRDLRERALLTVK